LKLRSQNSSAQEYSEEACYSQGLEWDREINKQRRQNKPPIRNIAKKKF
jgi:hypothetical protein